MAAKHLVETRNANAPEVLPVQLDFIQASERAEATQTTQREKDLEEKRRLAEDALRRAVAW